MRLKTDKFEKAQIRFHERMEALLRTEDEEKHSKSLRSKLNFYAAIKINNCSGECGLLGEVGYGLLYVLTRKKYYIPSFR